MTKEIWQVLQKHHKGQSHGFVFFSRKGNRIERISKSFPRIAGELFNQGISDTRQRVCFHTLRHTFASWLAQRGTELYSIKEVMGHSDFKMMQRYAHLATEGLRVKVKQFEGGGGFIKRMIRS